MFLWDWERWGIIAELQSLGADLPFRRNLGIENHTEHGISKLRDMFLERQALNKYRLIRVVEIRTLVRGREYPSLLRSDPERIGNLRWWLAEDAAAMYLKMESTSSSI